MAASKSSFLGKVLGRIGRLDSHGIQAVVERLARERSFLETLFNSIEEGILVVDASGRVIYSNQAIVPLLGFSMEALDGQPLHRALPQLDWEALNVFDRAGGPLVARHEFEISYPQPRFIRLYATPLDAEAKGRSGLALILHDATEARQKTFEAIESERVQALALLAGSVAHEIGNPLNALNLHVQLIERQLEKLKKVALSSHTTASPRGARSKKESASAGQEVAAIAETIQSFLGVAKGEISRLDYIITQFLQAIRPTPPRFETVSLNAVVEATVDLLRPEIENRGQKIVAALSRSLPEISLDPAQMKQVFVNLAKNAMQAMGKGGVLTFETGSTSGEIWARLSDTGRGIPRERLNRIFEPFFTTKAKGTGLGLMIVRRIVRSHGGRIELESQEGQGTTFRIWLPLRAKQPRLLQERHS